MSVEILPPAHIITPGDRAIAESIGLRPADHDALIRTEMHDLGDIKLDGETHRALRILSGPEGVTYQGGTKFKSYVNPEQQYGDTVDHGVAMFYKIGGIDETDFGGGKTVVNIDPYPEGLSEQSRQERRAEALHQLAGLIVDAGLADPRRNGTAGDQGTNGDIGIHYLAGLRQRGVPHPEACVTGKPDMAVRPSATGRGAAVVQRALMRLLGETESGVAIQGAGFAGAYYAAEAHAPTEETDSTIRIAPMALGDVRTITVGDQVYRVPVTLHTDHRHGLPITKSMIDSILLDREDPDMQEHGFDKLSALRAKIQRESGIHAQIIQKDVLTYDANSRPNMYLAPAATSNVLQEDNIRGVSIKKILEIGNHTVSTALLSRLGSMGIWIAPGELVNAGGVKISLDEKRRDLAKIAAAEAGESYVPIPDSTYEEGLYRTMVSTAERTHQVARRYNVPIATALKMVSLGNYAVANGMRIDGSMRGVLAK